MLKEELLLELERLRKETLDAIKGFEHWKRKYVEEWASRDGLEKEKEALKNLVNHRLRERNKLRIELRKMTAERDRLKNEINKLKS